MRSRNGRAELDDRQAGAATRPFVQLLQRIGYFFVIRCLSNACRAGSTRSRAAWVGTGSAHLACIWLRCVLAARPEAPVAKTKWNAHLIKDIHY